MAPSGERIGLKVETRTEPNHKSPARKLSPFGSQFQRYTSAGRYLIARIAGQDQLTSALSVQRFKSSSILSDAISGTPRHARQIQHHYFNPHAQCKWSVGEVNFRRYLLLRSTPRKFSWEIDLAMNAELQGGAAIFQTIDDHWQLSTSVRQEVFRFRSLSNFFRLELRALSSSYISRLDLIEAATRYPGTSQGQWSGKHVIAWDRI